MADFDPQQDAPLIVGERVRIVSAPRSGSDRQPWERHLDGRTGAIREFLRTDDAVMVTVLLDALTRRQRIAHLVRLRLWSSWQQGHDIIAREYPAPDALAHLG